MNNDPSVQGGTPIAFQETGLMRLIHNIKRKFTKKKESNLVQHARAELAILGGDEDGMQNAMNQHIIGMVKLFSEEGHSGFSASYSVNLLSKLLRFEPLTPLTGAEDEWTEVHEGTLQNKRCSHVFKENGQAYDIDGRIFREPDGGCFTSRDSRVNVTFPYTPKREYVDVMKDRANG